MVKFGQRRQTVTTHVGGVPVGSGAPIVVQSMTNTDTADAAGTAEQVAALARAGSDATLCVLPQGPRVIPFVST